MAQAIAETKAKRETIESIVDFKWLKLMVLMSDQ